MCEDWRTHNNYNSHHNYEQDAPSHYLNHYRDYQNIFDCFNNFDHDRNNISNYNYSPDRSYEYNNENLNNNRYICRNNYNHPLRQRFSSANIDLGIFISFFFFFNFIWKIDCLIQNNTVYSNKLKTVMWQGITKNFPK